MYIMYIVYMTATHFPTVNAARANFKALIDAAEDGRPALVSRDATTTALVDSDRFRTFLAGTATSNAQVVAEDGGWSILFPGLPIAADGSTLEAALENSIDALREYADDWCERLRTAPNHAQNWALVQLIQLSTDDQLKAWLTAA